MKNLFILFTVINITFFSYSQQVKYEKKLHNDFGSTVNTILQINNHNGNIIFNNWEKKEISVDVIITLWTKYDDNAQKYLDAADVILQQDSEKIAYKTVINYENLDKFFKKLEGKFQIDYIIYHPVYLNVDLKNSYGNITFNELSGKANINLNYGHLTAVNLAFNDSKPVSKIKLNYAKAKIGKCTWSEWKIDYSTLSIKTNTASVIKSHYSHVLINNSYGIFAASMYDDYKINNCKKLTLDAKYSDINIDTLQTDANINLNYGDFGIQRVESDFKNIQIVSNYTDVKAIIPDDACYQLDATVSYCEIKYSPKSNVNRHVSNSETKINGTIGCKQVRAKVYIESNYGDVKLF